MSSAAFPYPGSKQQLAPWIIGTFPAHHTFIEAFGGSAAITLSKEPSSVEVINDLDGDIVHFYDTLRDKCDDLVEWLRAVPHSRELHDRWGKEYYRGLRPHDDIERAGRWFYLRNTQFAQKYTGFSGFNGAKAKNHASKYDRKRERLWEIADRLRDVQIERLDFEDLFERYDSPETLFYCDPPYLDVDRPLYTGHDGFEHERFVDALEGLDGRWIVSYTTLPEGLQDGYHVAEQEKRNTMRAGQGDWGDSDTERLVMNFDPAAVDQFVDQEIVQGTLGDSP